MQISLQYSVVSADAKCRIKLTNTFSLRPVFFVLPHCFKVFIKVQLYFREAWSIVSHSAGLCYTDTNSMTNGQHLQSAHMSILRIQKINYRSVGKLKNRRISKCFSIRVRETWITPQLRIVYQASCTYTITSNNTVTSNKLPLESSLTSFRKQDEMINPHPVIKIIQSLETHIT